jgi:hypothetical protein
MAFAAIATTVAGLATGIAQTIKGNRERREALREADLYAPPALRNSLTGIATPQMMYNETTRQIEQSATDAYSTLALAGSRGMQMAGGVMDKTRTAEMQNVTQFEKSLFDMAMEQAKENMRIREMMEQRSLQEQAGIASKINAGTQTTTSGMQNMIGGLSGLAGLGRIESPEDAPENNIGNWSTPPKIKVPTFGVQPKSFGATTK